MQEITNKFFRKTVINGKEYQISVLPALPAMKMARTLGGVVLPILGGTLDGMRDESSFGVPKTFTELALVLCSQLNDIDLDDVITQLLDNVSCDGKTIDVNEHFRGDIGNMVELLTFALKENFSSFFTGKDILARLQGMVEKMHKGDSSSE